MGGEGEGAGGNASAKSAVEFSCKRKSEGRRIRAGGVEGSFAAQRAHKECHGQVLEGGGGEVEPGCRHGECHGGEVRGRGGEVGCFAGLIADDDSYDSGGEVRPPLEMGGGFCCEAKRDARLGEEGHPVARAEFRR